MSNPLAKNQFIAFFGIICHGIILSPTEKLIDNLLRKIYFIFTYFDLQGGVVNIFNYAGKVIILANGQIVNKQIKKMGPTYTPLGCSFVHIMPFVDNTLKYKSLFLIH